MSKSSLPPREASKDRSYPVIAYIWAVFVYSACPVFLDNYVVGEQIAAIWTLHLSLPLFTLFIATMWILVLHCLCPRQTLLISLGILSNQSSLTQPVFTSYLSSSIIPKKSTFHPFLQLLWVELSLQTIFLDSILTFLSYLLTHWKHFSLLTMWISSSNHLILQLLIT